MKTFYVIKGLKKGIWYYYREHDDRATQWDQDLYVARKFSTEARAKQFLADCCTEKNWGGYFQIDKYVVNS